MDKTQAAHLPRAIFVDARSHSNTAHDIMGNPQVSSLDWLIGAMKGRSPPTTLGTPSLTSLFGANKGDGNPCQLEGGQGSNRQDEGPWCQRGATSPNPNVRTKVEAATAAARRCNPRVDCRLVMASALHPKPHITVMSLMRAGCFDCLLFERCTKERCSFNHMRPTVARLELCSNSDPSVRPCVQYQVR